MIKKLFILFAFFALLTACNSSQDKTSSGENSDQEAMEETPTVSVADFSENTSNYTGKEIKIKGTVSHTCKEGGKRMFIYDESEDNMVKIDASKEIGSFNAELEGNEVIVTGTVVELVVDEDYLNNWENELNDGAAGEFKIHDGKHGGEVTDSVKIETLNKINNYRKEIAESGKDHLSYYSIECKSYEIVQPEEED